jgi:hypothetical protein
MSPDFAVLSKPEEKAYPPKGKDESVIWSNFKRSILVPFSTSP